MFTLHLFSLIAMASSADKAMSPLLFAGSLTAIAYAGTCLALYHAQAKLIFRPLPHLMSTPADSGLPYEDVWIPVSQETGADLEAGTLHGWWLPNPGSRQVLLLCHGNYGNISYNLERIRFYYNLGFSVFAFDYRGYGQSTGVGPTEQTTYADAEMAWQYLTAVRQIAPEQITVCGHSMGGAIAIHLATQQPRMANLIVKSSFTAMKDVVKGRAIYRFFPIEQLLTHPFDSLSKVSQLKVPVLYVHGDQDRDVPSFMSEHLYRASPDPKEIWLAKGANHNNIATLLGNAYGETVKAFCSNAWLQSARQSFG